MSDTSQGSADPWLVVGLGNPGDKYAGNRHNLGFMAVDHLAAELGGRFSSHRSRAQVLETRLPPQGGRPGPRVVLAKPGVYMNESGGPVAGLLKFYRVDLEQLLVVHDELDLPLGSVRLKRGGGEGGHNGLRSISKSVGGRDYARLRLGVGRPPGRMDPADFVLRDFPAGERTDREFMLGDATDAIHAVLVYGFVLAQTRFNTSS